MKKKKYLLVSLIVIVCILIFAFIITSVNKRRTIDNLMSQLENAINTHNINAIVKLYPNYCRDIIKKELSQSKLNEFHDKVGNITIKVIWQNNQESESKSLEIENKIRSEYDIELHIQDTQLVTINYHENFGESTLYVIKIKGEYYLYADYYLGEPIQYFIE